MLYYCNNNIIFNLIIIQENKNRSGEVSVFDDAFITRRESRKNAQRGLEKMIDLTVKERSATRKKYLLFQCVPSSETRGRRETHDNGCLKWGVRMTQRESLDVQTKCKWCGNRGRKNAGTVTVFENQKDAELEMYKRNSTLRFSNTTEVIE